MSLKTLLERKKSKIKKIEYYKNILNNNTIENLKSDIHRLSRNIKYINDDICDLQDLSKIDLKTTIQDFEDKKNEINKTEYELNIAQDKLKKINDLGVSDFNDIKNNINILENDIAILNEDISKKREEERKEQENKTNSGNTSDIDNKVWIDENLGIYIDIDKQAVIASVMKQVFKGGEIPDSLIEKYANPESGGIAALLEVFIGILIKAIGSFAKQFFFLKNTIDLLVGFQIGELLGNAIPGIVKVLQELKLLFTDPGKFMMKQLLGPLFDANIPIPKFCINIGDYIPFLPFNLCIPEIDPFGYLSKITPMNPNVDQTLIDSKWYAEIQKEIGELKTKQKDDALIKKNQKIKKIDDEINRLQNALNNNNIFTSQLNKCEKDLKILKTREQECQNNGCDEEHYKKICDNITTTEKCLNELRKSFNDEEKHIKYINKNEDLQKIKKLKEDKLLLKKTKLTTNYEYKKKAILVAYEQNIDSNDLDIKLSRIHEIGVDINNPDNLEILQKIGHNFSNDKYINRLEELKNYQISLSNVKQLRTLFELGFNFNDPNYKEKISKILYYVSLNSIHLTMLVEMGLNLHNPNIFEMLRTLKNMNIDILNVDILVRLQTIGFNFNNPNSINRLTILGKYLDLSDVNAFNTALKRNINLNNPYFESILEKTFLIGLRWGESNEQGYFEMENEIKNDNNIPSNVDTIKNILDIFKKGNLYSYQNYLENINEYNIIINNYGSYIDMNKLQYIDIEGDVIPTSYTQIDENDSGVTYVISSTLLSLTLSHFYDIINKYKKYGIVLDIPLLKNIYPYSGNYVYNSDITSRHIKDIDIFLKKLNTLKEFQVNQGWVVNQNGKNIHVDENIGGYNVDENFNNTNNDYNNISGLQNVVLENPNKNEITFDTLKAVVGNFDQLGLNIRDIDFQDKFDSLFETFKITIDSSVIINTTRNVLLTYEDVDNWVGSGIDRHHEMKTINLNTSKADPKLFSESKYGASITITETRNTNISNEPAKTIAQFDILQKLGFNYQKPYKDFFNLFGSLKLSLKEYESKLISDSLISLGWHYTSDTDFFKLKKFINFGFSFEIFKSIENQSIDNFVKNMKPQMYGKLEHLNTIGFNFNRTDYLIIINSLETIGLLLSNINFEKVIEKFIAFGINFNDSDWKSKIQVFIDNNISFIDGGDWLEQIDNLIYLGIDFNGEDWRTKYNKIENMRQIGLDFTKSDLNKKISILVNLGIDFNKPNDEWMEKINSLVLLKLINISENSQQNKNIYLNERQNKINKINKDINKYEELNINPSYIIDDKINILSIELKKLISNDNDNTRICILQDELDNLLNDKISIIKIKPDYTTEINILKSEKEKLKNESFRLNNDLIFKDLDMFKELEKSGFNFFDDDYKKNTQLLLDNGFNFEKPDWKDELKTLSGLIQGNPILAWRKVLIDIIKTVVMMPIMMLMDIIKKLVDMITSVIEIPLNPLEIPDWAKGIIVKFLDLVKLIMSLPTLEGMLDFLFMSKNGLMLIDIFVPGFSAFVSMLMEKIKSWKNQLIEKKKQLQEKQELLKNLKQDLLLKKNKLNLLSTPDTEKSNTKKNIKIQQALLLNKNEQLKSIVEIGDLNIQEIKNIQKTLDDNCNLIDNYDEILKENTNLTDVELENKINTLENDINSTTIKLDKINNDVSKIKSENKILEDKLNNMGDFCSWGENIDDLILKILKGLGDDIKNKINPNEENLNINKNKISELEKTKNILVSQKKAIEGKLNGNDISSPQQVKNNIRIVELNNMIKKIQSDVCNNNYTQNKIDYFDSLILSYNKEIKELFIGSKIDTSSLHLYDNKINNINDEIDKLKLKEENLKQKSKDFSIANNLLLSQLEGVTKWLPTILNIVCSLPKMIVNIFIGIINGVGHMDFLPTLWEFPYI